MNKRKLPIGIQTFREIREEGCYYVDKTPCLRRLVDEGKHYLLARPRRFGKSLLLDTLKELFEGNEPLFEGLDIHCHWDWSVRHPVVRFDFGGGDFKESGCLHKEVMAQLTAIEDEAAVEGRCDTAPARFHHLLQALHRQAGQRVVVLVDDYDKPILDAWDQPEAARANRDYLLGLYSTIKSSDAHVQFTLLAGVGKFPTAGLFSGLNNLIDIILESAPLRHLRLHRCGSGHGVRARASRTGPAGHPRVVRRLQLAGRGERLQPVRHPLALPPPRVRRLVVRDRDALVPD